GKILDLRLPRSTRLSYKEMSDLLLEKIKEDIWKWFYCKHKRSLEEVYLVDYYLKNVTVDDSNKEVTSIYRSHENAKKNVDTMSFEELVAWEKEEAMFLL
ncbi:hypothetical protein Tco_0220570, partial [Tanacetum coccineum]